MTHDRRHRDRRDRPSMGLRKRIRRTLIHRWTRDRRIRILQRDIDRRNL